MSLSARYTIAELEEKTGQPRRTIHHYVSRGLLPKAEGRGPAAYYTREHYLKLSLIGLLAEAGIGTDMIQRSFETWSLDDMEQLVEMAQNQSIDDLDTLGRWLSPGGGALVSKRIAADLEGWKPEQTTVSPNLDAAASGEPHAVESLRYEVSYDLGFEALDDLVDETFDDLGGERAPESPAIERASAARPSPPLPAADTWKRLRVGAALEISYQPTSDRRFRGKLRQLEAFVRELFADELDS